MGTISIKLTQVLLILAFIAATSLAQTMAFSYHGRLTEGGNPANGAYQM